MKPSPQGQYKKKCLECNQKCWDYEYANEDELICKSCIYFRRVSMEDAIRDFIVSLTFEKKPREQHPYSMLEMATALNAIQGLLAQLPKSTPPPSGPSGPKQVD